VGDGPVRGVRPARRWADARALQSFSPRWMRSASNRDRRTASASSEERTAALVSTSCGGSVGRGRRPGVGRLTSMSPARLRRSPMAGRPDGGGRGRLGRWCRRVEWRALMGCNQALPGRCSSQNSAAIVLYRRTGFMEEGPAHQTYRETSGSCGIDRDGLQQNTIGPPYSSFALIISVPR